ncbi:YtpR family tRNA-binding protein [Sporosarcina sp. NPDC096371]|uniref:YtpR family tRNA-binding protein n=1 Tax=Sporosarcina sp. NPDC096371 TaxID=3364530 RepID=UPI003824351A
MNLFYNRNGVGDVLLIQHTVTRPDSIITASYGDVTVIRNAETGEVAAINLFQASSYFAIETVGKVELTEEVVKQLQAAFQKNGAEVELDADFSPKFVVGHVLTKEKHPNADKLNICTVDIGSETVQIVCGAPNVDAGQKVVVAKIGAVMPSGMVIRDAELRGIASSGMICSAKELALPNAPEEKGILVLENNALVGEAFTM